VCWCRSKQHGAGDACTCPQYSRASQTHTAFSVGVPDDGEVRKTNAVDKEVVCRTDGLTFGEVESHVTTRVGKVGSCLGPLSRFLAFPKLFPDWPVWRTYLRASHFGILCLFWKTKLKQAYEITLLFVCLYVYLPPSRGAPCSHWWDFGKTLQHVQFRFYKNRVCITVCWDTYVYTIKFCSTCRFKYSVCSKKNYYYYYYY
jgi:hypothetical protein